jgi:pyruvate/2-oxoglutarate/acetoin dehydrogenase E1 component
MSKEKDKVRKLSYAQAVAEALNEEMTRDPDVFLMGEDIGRFGNIYGATRGLLEAFGKERVRDTPISEAAIVGAAVGASLLGMRPVVEIMYMDFMTIAADQIVNHAAKFRYMFGGSVELPLVIRTQGGTGTSNAAQHSQSLESWFMHTPGLHVVMPSTPYDAKGLLKASIREDNPVIFIEHKSLYKTWGPVPEEEYLIPLGQADVKREGKDITVVATSLMVQRALGAAEEVEKEGGSVEVIDPRTLSPLDEETILNSARKTGKVIVVHEACKTCGIGAEIAARIMEKAFDYMDAPVVRLGGLDIPVPYARNLEEASVPSQEQIVQAIRKVACYT